jgi:hypothetical protein
MATQRGRWQIAAPTGGRTAIWQSSAEFEIYRAKLDKNGAPAASKRHSGLAPGMLLPTLANVNRASTFIVEYLAVETAFRANHAVIESIFIQYISWQRATPRDSLLQ